MEITVGLTLPRDELSVPVARHVCKDALLDIGVEQACADDIEIALAEACTNVIDHSGPGDEYRIEVAVDGKLCVIRVIDTGHGFSRERLAGSGGDLTAERGRGVALMRALMDRIEFVPRDEAGTIVHLEKGLRLVDDGPGAQLSRRS